MIDTTKEGISITAGPDILEQPCYSFDLRAIAEYQPNDISEAISGFPGIKIMNSGEPEWWNWSARLTRNNVSIDISMSIFEADRITFCSLDFDGVCQIDLLIELLNYLKLCGFSALWFHDQSAEMYTPEHFKKRFDARV